LFLGSPRNIDASPNIIKVLTPKYKYKNTIQNSTIPLSDNSPAISISPKITPWVSDLINMPSPQKKQKIKNDHKSPKKLIAKNNIIQEKLNNARKLLQQKRAIITSLKKKVDVKTNIKKNLIHNFFSQTNFPSANSKLLVNMQLMDKIRKPWPMKEKKLALSIYYKSHPTYPPRRWLNSIKYLLDLLKNI